VLDVEVRTGRGRRSVAVVALALPLPLGIWAASTASGGQMQSGTSLVAALDVRQEVPKPSGVSARAKGTFTATLVPAGSAGTLTWKLTFRNLSGRAIAAHVHLGRAGRAGPVAVPLCGPCTARASGRSRVTAAARRALQGGGAYVNVHTQKNPAGEIRGQVRARTGSGSSQPPPTQPAPAPPSDPYPPYP
jgi:hypothetical protein